ncbi:MAG: hypothetical protein ABI600_06785 [Luteolibacter sp.]
MRFPRQAPQNHGSETEWLRASRLYRECAHHLFYGGSAVARLLRLLAWCGLVMAGGSDEVAVAGMKIEVFQTLESGEGIWQGPTHVGLGFRENFAEQSK